MSDYEDQKTPCPQCGSTFTQKGNLLKHIKSVHEGQKFECPQCEYKVTRKYSLQMHIKSKHPVKEEYLEDDIKQEFRVDKKEVISLKKDNLEEDMMKKEEYENSDNGEYFEEDIKQEC